MVLAADKRDSRRIRNAAVCTDKLGKTLGTVQAADRAVDTADDKVFAAADTPDGRDKSRDGTRKIRNIR